MDGSAQDENAVAGSVVSSGSSGLGSFDTISATSTPAADADARNLTIEALGSDDPVYVAVGTGPFQRTGAAATDLGVRFPTGFNAKPLTNADGFTPEDDDLSASGGNNYTGITQRGMQFWTYPETGDKIDIVSDAGFSVGISSVGQGNTWRAVLGDREDGDDAIVTTTPVVFDQWHHVMHFWSDALSVLYVNGQAVAAANAGRPGATTSPLLIGNDNTGVNGFGGIVDNLEFFVWGDNSATPGGADWGDFDPFTDNEFISSALGSNLPGDVNLDGVVNGDGTLAADVDDVTAFMEGWNFRKRVDGVLVGDLETRLNGDLNGDGRTNLGDWFILDQNHPGPLGSLASYLAVPEPASWLLLCPAGLLLLSGRRRPTEQTPACSGRPLPGRRCCSAKLIGVSAAALLLIAGPARASILWNFDEEDLQGWTSVLTSSFAGGPMEWRAFPGENGTNIGGQGGTNNGILPSEFEAADGGNTRDRDHDPLLLRSPEFGIDAALPISFYFVGGQAPGLSDISGITSASVANGGAFGFQGLALRRVSDDTYLLSEGRTEDSNSWVKQTFDAAELEPHVSETETYTLDLVDAKSGGWGWVGLDTVQVAAVTETPDLLVSVDDATGAVTIDSLSSLAFDIKGYSLFSDAGSLDDNDWKSISDRNSDWGELTAPGSTTDLAEATFGQLTVGPTWSRYLGNVFNTGNAEDLTVEFLTTDGTLFEGIVQYGDFPAPSLNADVDGNGVVDGADFLQIQRTNPALIVLAMGLKPSPLGESFRFLYWRYGKLSNRFSQSL